MIANPSRSRSITQSTPVEARRRSRQVCPSGHRVDDAQFAALDKALRDADAPRDGCQRRLLFLLDRLDETVAEPRANVVTVPAVEPGERSEVREPGAGTRGL